MAYLHKETRNTSFIHFENRVIELKQQESQTGGEREIGGENEEDGRKWEGRLKYNINTPSLSYNK